MTTLKALRTRKGSVQATQKITMAMKMVAAAKLRRAQEELDAGRPYAHLMYQILCGIAQRTIALDTPQPLLSGTGKHTVHLFVVATSDRGLCGPFNTSIIKHTRQLIAETRGAGQEVKLLCIGRRGKTMLERDFKDLVIESVADIGSPRLSFSTAETIGERLVTLFNEGAFDTCSLIYNRFYSALRQEVEAQQIIPLQRETLSDVKPIYTYEPDEASLLTQLLHQNIAVQVYHALSENAASEEGARMAAMENASKNAEDMIRSLTLSYNRTRQTHITRELIEIISGAEAL